jgi:RNA polymerase sigma-70 factor (ECF subfamily)
MATVDEPKGPHRVAHAADVAVIAALRTGDEAAFRALVARHHAALVRVARTSVSSHAVAEEVAQETWLAVIQGIDRFEGRSSLKSWIFAIVANRARSRGVREHRSIPMSSLGGAGDDAPAVDADRFVRTGERWAGHWCSPPVPWEPAERLLAQETRGVVAAAIARLPQQQRVVLSLRDVEGWSSEEVCALLELSEGNQRVLLHRGRAKVRAALEAHLGAEG